jgi:tetratricopeptide (TPR) repeat protein
MPLRRTSQILEALQVQRVKPDSARGPANDHEARLLAERALQTGLEHMKSGRYDQAAEELQRAGRLQPQSTECRLYHKWCVIRARGELPHPTERVELRRLATAAVGADPNLAFGYYVQGDLALSEGRDKEALRVLSRAAKLDPDLLDVQRLLRILERRGGPAKPEPGGG